MPSMPPPLSSAQVLQQLSGQAAPSPTHLISETIPPSVSWLNLVPISPAGHPKLALSSQIQREPQPGMSARSSQSPRQSQKPSSASKSPGINHLIPELPGPLLTSIFYQPLRPWRPWREKTPHAKDAKAATYYFSFTNLRVLGDRGVSKLLLPKNHVLV